MRYVLRIGLGILLGTGTLTLIKCALFHSSQDRATGRKQSLYILLQNRIPGEIFWCGYAWQTFQVFLGRFRAPSERALCRNHGWTVSKTERTLRSAFFVFPNKHGFRPTFPPASMCSFLSAVCWAIFCDLRS